MIELLLCIIMAIGGLIVLPFACVMLWCLMILYVLLKGLVHLARSAFHFPRQILRKVKDAGF